MSIKLWGGVECTVNRVGDAYYDQLEKSGHARRVEDLELFANLGIKALRYPILWERTAPEGIPDWNWADDRLARLRELGVRPIAGLLHHGSGPRYTSLVDENFPKLFAAFARSVAERFPWIEDYTPINEPLTTARFSGLYGHWYPHSRSDRSFTRAFLQQCRAIVLAMREIRRVNSSARLIQTEDLGKTYSTKLLAYQAKFENERRWLTWDILCGKLTREHSWWPYFRRAGVEERELIWFHDNPCSPDVVGINHYLTSERYIDENIERYPDHVCGGNRSHRYADVEAVRVEFSGDLGPEARIQEAWRRYHLPIAITEAHLGCTSEEQVRWFRHVWNAADNQRRRGVDIQAVTTWALLGSFHWNCLLTCENGYYEPGAFDVRSGERLRTPLAELLQKIGEGAGHEHLIGHEPGWWLRPERIYYPAGADESVVACYPDLRENKIQPSL